MRRSLDDFLINPTTSAMKRHSLATAPSDENITMMPRHEIFPFKPARKASKSARIMNFPNEPIFGRGYTSEEEMASPIDDSDDASLHSASSVVIISPTKHARKSSFPEQLAQSCNRVEQQCSRAQAVRFVPAGKAKVVSMPRLVDLSATPRMRRPATNTSIHPQLTPIRPLVSRMSRIEIGSQTSSRTNSPQRTSSERSPVSTAPSSVVELPKTTAFSSFAEQPKRVKTVRRRPSLPALFVAARTSNASDSSPEPASTTRRVNFLDHDPFPSSSADRPTTPMSPSKRRLHKFSSSLGLNVFGRGLRWNSSTDSDVGGDLNVVKEPEPILISTSRLSVQPTSHIRNPSIKTKMVARGASEREPPLVLPPCPDDYDDDDSNYNVASTGWPSRKDSQAPNALTRNPSSARMLKLHKRKSYSAAVVPEQV